MFLSNTEEAILFGKDASQEDIKNLKKFRKHFINISQNYRKQKRLDESLFFAVKAQFCREAIETKEGYNGN